MRCKVDYNMLKGEMKKVTDFIDEYLMRIIGICIVFLIAYYIYFLYSINAITIEPFTKPKELIFSIDMKEYVDRPNDLVRTIITVYHFYIMIAGVIGYFLLLVKFFNPFPHPNDNGIYIFMIDSNRLHILRLKESYSKVFIWNKKAYFLPRQSFAYNNNIIMLYNSSMSIAIGTLTITKEDIEQVLKELVNYTYSTQAYYNKISKFYQIYPRDVRTRVYDLVIDISNNTIKIEKSRSKMKGSYSITRFVSCNIYIKKMQEIEEEEDNITEEYSENKLIPKFVIGKIEIPVISFQENQQLMQKKLVNILKHVDYGISITNPYLTYDILKYRKIINNLHKYFIGSLTTNKMLPILFIIIAIVLAVILVPQFMQSNPFQVTPTQPK